MRVMSKVVTGGGVVLAALLAAGFGAQPASARGVTAQSVSARADPARAGAAHGTVPACQQYGLSAIQRHITVTSVPDACRDLSQVQVNQAVAAAIRQVTGARPKAARRKLAAQVAPELAFLVGTPGPAARPVPAAPYAPGGPVTRRSPGGDRGLSVAALLAWIVTAGSGGYLLASWLRSGGSLHARTSGAGVPPAPTAHFATRAHPATAAHVTAAHPATAADLATAAHSATVTPPATAVPPGAIVAHFGLAAAGLALWVVFLIAGSPALAWIAGALLLPVAGLGLGLVTLGLPGGRPRLARPGAGQPVGVGAMGAARASGRAPVLVVAGHGVLAAATLLLVLLAAIGSGGNL